MVKMNRKVLSVFEESELRKTISKRKSEKICKLMKKIGVKLSDCSFNPSLNETIRVGNLKRTKLLIHTGADVNKRGRNTWTPLHMAANYGHYKIVEFLIQEGAKVDSVLTGANGGGFTPLHLAVLWNHLKCVQLLLENGASVSPNSQDVCHPLLIAVFNNHVEMATLLLDHGADVDLRFSNNFFEGFRDIMHTNLWWDHDLPLLHFAILKKSKKMRRLLLQYGADMNSKSSLGKTTLMQAVEANDYRMVRLLVNEGEADVNERDIFGQPVLHFIMVNANRKVWIYSKEESALEKKKGDILDFLIKNGADVNARFPESDNHSTVIHYMIKYGFEMGVLHLLFQSDLDPAGIDFETVRSANIVEREAGSDLDYITQLDSKFKSIMGILVRWAVMRHVVGWPVDKKIIDCPIHEWIPMDEYKKAVDGITKDVRIEVEFMKQTTIGGRSDTIWDLLTCDMIKLVKLMSNKTVRYFDIIDRNRMKIHHFCLPLVYRLYIGKKRRIFLEDSAELIGRLFIQKLPYDCCRNIVGYLKDNELEAICFKNQESL